MDTPIAELIVKINYLRKKINIIDAQFRSYDFSYADNKYLRAMCFDSVNGVYESIFVVMISCFIGLFLSIYLKSMILGIISIFILLFSPLFVGIIHANYRRELLIIKIITQLNKYKLNNHLSVALKLITENKITTYLRLFPSISQIYDIIDPVCIDIENPLCSLAHVNHIEYINYIYNKLTMLDCITR